MEDARDVRARPVSQSPRVLDAARERVTASKRAQLRAIDPPVSEYRFGMGERSVGDAKASVQIASLRRLSILAGTVYLAWWFVVEAVLPNSYNPFVGRGFVVILFFSA